MILVQNYLLSKSCKERNLGQPNKLTDMNRERHPFVFNYGEDVKVTQYLGSDGVPVAETHDLYVRKCEEFKAKARKYARDNMSTKNSTLHHFKYGYNGTQQLEEDVFLERMEFVKNYDLNFDATFFYEDPNSMYECFTGKSKRIRVLRELQQERNEEFTSDFDKKRATWFTRYCILSRFIEAARTIILLNRLNAVLAKLRTVTPEQIRQIESGTIMEEEEDNLNETSQLNIQPCRCDPK